MKKAGLILVALIILGAMFWLKLGLRRVKTVIPEKGGEKIKSKMEKTKILMVIAPRNFRDEEFLRPKEIFEKSGFLITVASKEVKEASGALGHRAKVDLDLSQVKPADYDALVFIGGSGASIYLEDKVVLRLAKTADEQGKVIGAICLAPSILANAGILSGKRATAFPSEAENLRNKGAEYTGEPIAVDGQIVTANGPAAAIEFGEKIRDLLTNR